MNGSGTLARKKIVILGILLIPALVLIILLMPVVLGAGVTVIKKIAGLITLTALVLLSLLALGKDILLPAGAMRLIAGHGIRSKEETKAFVPAILMD